MTKAKIVIVESESIIAMDIQTRLKKAGYISTVAYSGEEAINKVAETLPDLVLIATPLKGSMDGVEVAKQICTRFNISVIYLINCKINKSLEQFRYISKPFKEQELYNAIERTLLKKNCLMKNSQL